MNLFLCFTPLQAVIVEKIICEHTKGDAILVYLSDSEDKKVNIYFNRVSKHCKKSYLVQITKNKVMNLLELRKIAKLMPEFKSVNLASIDNVYFLYLLSKLRFNSLNTFDDGLSNIIQTSTYYSVLKESFFHNLSLRVLGIKYNRDTLKKMSKCHFSIYPKRFKNIIDQEYVIEIKVFNENLNDFRRDKVVKIFLGQPLYHNDILRTKTKIQSAVDFIKPDFYFKHPRESFEIDNIKYIESDLIFEDFALKFLNDNRDTKLEIYSFFSSCMVNLYSVKAITSFYIWDKSYNRMGIYELFDCFALQKIDI